MNNEQTAYFGELKVFIVPFPEYLDDDEIPFRGTKETYCSVRPIALHWHTIIGATKFLQRTSYFLWNFAKWLYHKFSYSTIFGFKLFKPFMWFEHIFTFRIYLHCNALMHRMAYYAGYRVYDGQWCRWCGRLKHGRQ